MAGLALVALLAIPFTSRASVDVSVGLAIGTPPPAPRHEVVIAQPSPRHVWIPGYWGWRKNHHVWIAGRWELPPREHVVYVPPRWETRGNGYVLVEGQWVDASAPTNTTEIPTEVMVSQPPPAPPPETISERPSPQQVWLAGYWRWELNAYKWVPGHWELPPTPSAAYNAPHWEERGNGYAFYPGYWQEGATQATGSAQVVVTEPPPPVVHEVVVARPSGRHVWINGYWYWRGGHYVWAPGRWELPPRKHAVYAPPHWERRGHGYIMIQGTWR